MKYLNSKSKSTSESFSFSGSPFDKSKISPLNLTFVQRNIYSMGNADGVIAAVPLTVWRDCEDRWILIPDNPADSSDLVMIMNSRKKGTES